ncbi:Gfo/Idh/MocA family oxidoreductase [Planotetraspora sp. A-T 1434]|uniref:Gfo/Idh/MocA family protein n=1 Tax=Planotetraspora sp. A-T 1434 TaxID=2979219 RepID=UPI0021C24074|nr:Gfo/Idh/MocA family oxidoreductase [Planotetraspora sp. A-T 1434]MCT9929287.1 Gfo/Idh/MocA family oxidoreductase [Planotetraspora sp. A-T 1434]
MRLVAVGVGANVWHMHLPGVAAIGGSVVGVHDVDTEKAKRAAADLGCSAFDDLDGLLEQPADVAVVLAPHRLHHDLVVRCLRAGLHVLVEKPIAVTAADADQMCAEAERADRLLAVALQQRARPEVRHAQRLIAEGFLGEVRRVELVSSWPRRSSYFGTAPWRGTWAGEGGGVLVNQGQHDLDLLCLLAGLPDRVTARTRVVQHPVQTQDTAAALLEWAGGAYGTLHVTTAAADEVQRIELTGTAGRMRLTPGRLDLWRSAVDFRDYAADPGDPYAAPSEERLESVTGRRGTHTDLYENLDRALRGEEPPLGAGRSALAAVELANAIQLSADQHGEVDLPVNRDTYRRFLERETS